MRFPKFFLIAAASTGVFSTVASVDGTVINNHRLYTTSGYYNNAETDQLKGEVFLLMPDGSGGAWATIPDISGNSLGAVIVDANVTLNLDSSQSLTFQGTFFGTGNLVKNGTGTLQYNGFADDSNWNLTGSVIGTGLYSIRYYRNSTYFTYEPIVDPLTGRLVTQLVSYPAQMGNEPNARYYDRYDSRFYNSGTETMATFGALSGTVTINAGELDVRGYLSQWREFPVSGPNGAAWNYDAVAAGAGDDKMVGVSEVVLNGTAMLNFQNSNANIVNAPIRWDGSWPETTQPQILRLNFANNLKAGLENNQYQTQVQTGLDDDYRILVYIDADHKDLTLDGGGDNAGSIGILSGKGRFYKAGPGDFKVLNNSTFSGDIFLAGGKTILDPLVMSASGDMMSDEIWKYVGSVNLVGVQGGGTRGAYMNSELHGAYGPPNYPYEFKMGYVPNPEAAVDAAQLVITCDQQIRNLQVLFAESSAPTDAPTIQSAVRNAIAQNPAEIYIAGTGQGTNIQINDHTLTIIQDLDGVYQGTINADWTDSDHAGTIVKRGGAKLALLPTVAKYDTLIIEEGTVIANVQGLGWSSVKIAGGALTVFQGDSGTLNASIEASADSVLLFTANAFVTNGSGAQINVGNNVAGTVYVTRPQNDFHGIIIVEEGLTLQLGAETNTGGMNNSFANSQAFILRAGESKRETSLYINGSDQRIRNFNGDEYARVRLGTGALSLLQEEDTVFLGKISQQGTLLKEGAGTFYLSGKNDFYGATVAKEGRLVLNAANTIESTAGLIIKNGATVSTSGFAQQVGALFGEKGAVLQIDAGVLTVGMTEKRYAELRAEEFSGTQDLLNQNYLATATNGFKNPGDVNSIVESTRATEGTTVGFLKNELIALDNATRMAYSGTLVGNGDLVKIGRERLTLDGVSDAFTGKVEIRQGIVRINADSLNSSQGIYFNPFASNYYTDAQEARRPAILEVNADVLKSIDLSIGINGKGDLHKVGAGEARFSTSAAIQYTGRTIIEQGRLVVGAGFLTTRTSALGVENSGTLVMNFSSFNDENTLTLPVAIGGEGTGGGTGGIEKIGTGKLILTGDLQYGHVEQNLTSLGRSLLALDPEFAAGPLTSGIVFKKSDASMIILPENARGVPEGSRMLPNGTIVLPDGSRLSGYGAVLARPDGGEIYHPITGERYAYVLVPDGTLLERVSDGTTTPIILRSATEDTVFVAPDGTTYGLSNGMTSVLEGELVIQSVPRTVDGHYSIFEIANEAALTFDATQSGNSFNGELLGGGVFNKDGSENFAITEAQDGFSGIFNIRNGSVSLECEDALAQAKEVSLSAGTRLTMNGNDQAFKFLYGDKTSTVDTAGATLTFDVGANADDARVYSGRIVGGGAVRKTGAGMITLWRPEDATVANILGSVEIEEGVLQAAPTALGAATVSVARDAELRFYTEKGEAQSYAGAVTGDGFIGKGGEGTVHLTGSLALPNGNPQFKISGGRLIVDESRIGGVVPNAQVEFGATFQLNLQTTTTLTLGTTEVTGNGNLAISGPTGTVLTIDETPLGYSGRTELLGGVTLQFNNGNWNWRPNLIGGLAGGVDPDDSSGVLPTLELSGLDALVVKQNVDGIFNGYIRGSSSDGTGESGLCIKDGAGRLIYTGENGMLNDSVGYVVVDNGHFGVGVLNTHAIDVINGGTLYIGNYDSASGNFETYTGVVTNNNDTNFNLTFTGRVAMDGQAFTNVLSGKNIRQLGVESGTLRLEVSAGDNIIGSDGVIPASSLYAGNEGVLDIRVSGGVNVARLDAIITGSGSLAKSGAGALSLIGVQGYTGETTVREGILEGNFVVQGTLRNEAVLAPGNTSARVITERNFIQAIETKGDFIQTNTGTLSLEINKTSIDKVVYGGTARLDGTVAITTLDSVPSRGTVYVFLEKAGGGVPSVEYGDNLRFVINRTDANANYIFVGPGLGVNTAYEALGSKGPAILVAQEMISRVPGYKQHRGLDEFLPELDRIATDGVPLTTNIASIDAVTWARYEIGSYVNTASERELAQVVNNFSPLGYGSLLGMPAGAGHSSVEHLHGRLEQRRYDHALYSLQEWQAYVSATSTFANHGDGTKDPVYNYSINGGVIGVDRQFSESDLLGGSVEYSHGTAQMHEGGGKMRMSAVRLSAYWSHSFSEWFFLDVGVNGGYLGYDVKRETPTGQNTAEPEGWSLGTFATVSTVFPLMTQEMKLHAVPYVGVEYGHYVVNAFEEAGSVSRLGVEKFGYDTLRAKIGSGLNWEVEGDWEWQWRVGLNAAFAQELLDVESEVDAAFAQAGGGKFRVKTRVQTRSSVQIGPSVSVNLNDRTSVYANYRLEVGFDGATYNNINLGFRTRF